MNLHKEEIAVALGLLIKKDPIVCISVNEDVISFTHLSKKVQTIETPFKNITNVTEQINNTIQQEIDTDLLKKQIVEYVDSKISNLEKNDPDLTIYDNLIEDINKKIDSINNKEEKIIREEYDPTNLIIDIESRLSDLSNKINEKNQPIVNNIVKESIDYNVLNEIIDTRFEELNQPQIDKNDCVVDIFSRMGSVYVSFESGKEKDISRLFEVNILAGGGSKGLSAYEIAIKHGFVGSEQQWLNSLTTGTNPPSDTIISYDVDGNVETITNDYTTTIINRDNQGNIVSINKGNYTKTLTYNNDGLLTGWIVT